MKKIIAAILAFVYISTSAGATIHIHYCMGKPADRSLWKDKSSQCSTCGMEKSETDDNGCCKDEHQFIKNSADQKATESVSPLTVSPVTSHPARGIDLSFSHIPFVPEKKPVSHAPSRCGGPDVFLLNCVFLI